MAFHHRGTVINFDETKSFTLLVFFANILIGIKNNGKKRALCNSLFVSRGTSLDNADISSFCIKGLKYFEEPLGSCKRLSKTVSYLVSSCMTERKLPLLSYYNIIWVEQLIRIA